MHNNSNPSQKIEMFFKLSLFMKRLKNAISYLFACALYFYYRSIIVIVAELKDNTNFKSF